MRRATTKRFCGAMLLRAPLSVPGTDVRALLLGIVLCAAAAQPAPAQDASTEQAHDPYAQQADDQGQDDIEDDFRSEYDDVPQQWSDSGEDAADAEEGVPQVDEPTPLEYGEPGAEHDRVDIETVDTIPVEPLDPERNRATPADEDADTAPIETIVVTAGKRMQDIRDVAGSVSVMTGDALERIGAQSMADYIKYVPGVVLAENDADRSVPVIRGITASVLPGFGAQTTGIFVDEIPLNDMFLVSSNIDMNPFDLERVEVLKGPQGTLFGSSSIAGAIRYITKKPELGAWQVKAMGAYSSIEHGGQKPLGAAMVNVPLGDTVALRAVGLYRESPGYIDDTGRRLEDINELEQDAERVLLRWRPSEDWDLSATYLRQRSFQADSAFADSREQLERSNTPGASPRESKFSVANFVATYAFDWGKALSSSSYVTKDSYFITNTDRILGLGTAGTPNPNGGTDGPGLEDLGFPLSVVSLSSSLHGFVQELRLSSFEGPGDWQWQAGLSYMRYTDDYEQTSHNTIVDAVLDLLSIDLDALPIFPIDTPIGRIFGLRELQLLYASQNSVATETALFGEVTRRLGERWELNLGGRLFRTRLVNDSVVAGLQVLALTARTEDVRRNRIEEEGFNPKASLRFMFNENVNLYALASKGFQFGGVQINPPTLALNTLASQSAGPAAEPYKSSDLWNYEIGARTEWWDRRLMLDATLFWMDWKDLQLFQIESFAGAGVFTVRANVGKAHSKGAELALQARPFGGFGLRTSASFIDARTDVDFETTDGTVPAGTQLPGSSKFQIASTLSYLQPFSLLGSSWAVDASVAHTYIGRIYNDLQHSAEFGDYETYDLSLHLMNKNLRWEPDLSLTLTNLLDERAVTSVATCTTCRQEDIYFVRPRTLTLTLALRLF